MTSYIEEVKTAAQGLVQAEKEDNVAAYVYHSTAFVAAMGALEAAIKLTNEEIAQEEKAWLKEMRENVREHYTTH